MSHLIKVVKKKTYAPSVVKGEGSLGKLYQVNWIFLWLSYFLQKKSSLLGYVFYIKLFHQLHTFSWMYPAWPL